jgi:hypothetical protein
LKDWSLLRSVYAKQLNCVAPYKIVPYDWSLCRGTQLEQLVVYFGSIVQNT